MWVREEGSSGRGRYRHAQLSLGAGYLTRAGEMSPFGGNVYPGEQKITRMTAKRPDNRKVTSPRIALETCPGGIRVGDGGETEMETHTYTQARAHTHTQACCRQNPQFLTTDQVQWPSHAFQVAS